MLQILFFIYHRSMVFGLLICLLPAVLLQGQTLQGTMFDKVSNAPLPYASVGIKNRNNGGIADKHGRFNIDLSNIPSSDSIVFSHIGYRSVTFRVGDMDSSGNVLIYLRREERQLNEVVVSAKKDVYIVGMEKYSNRFTGWGDYSSSRGRARGLEMIPGKFPIKAVTFLCRIKHNTFDSVKVRLNIFRKNNTAAEFEQVLHENIYFTIRKNAKWVAVDVSKYNIVIKDTVVVALEWIDAWTPANRPLEKSHLFTIALGYTKGYSYQRNTPNELPSLQQNTELPVMYFRGHRVGKIK